MKLLLIEDDENECNKFKKLAEKRKDIELVGITNSELEGINILKKKAVDGIILDLELNEGQGNGFDFIQNFETLKYSVKPKIVITTNVYSNSVYDFLHDKRVDFIFCKRQENYSAESVVNALLLINNYKTKETLKNEEIVDTENDVITDKINYELDLIGVSSHLQGRKYIFDAIYYLLSQEGNNSKISINQYLTAKYKKSSSTISRAMQNAILHAWRISSVDDLEKYYTAKVSYETGIPTPMEFIYYYVDKAKKEL